MISVVSVLRDGVIISLLMLHVQKELVSVCFSS